MISDVTMPGVRTVGYAVALLASPLIGCSNADTHASHYYDGTPSQPPETTPIELDGRRLYGPLKANESWLEADTTVEMRFDANGDGSVDVYVSHQGGTLLADGRNIPPDTWLLMAGAYDAEEERLHATAEQSGHNLECDADLVADPESGALALRGYFIADDTGVVWLELDSQ